MVEQLILERKASSTQKTYKYHLSSRTHLLMVFIAIYFRYLGFKNPSIAKAIQGFLKPNYRKYLSPKISRIIMSYYLAELFVFYKDLKPEEITKKQLIHFLLHKIRFKKIAESTQNQIISAVKVY